VLDFGAGLIDPEAWIAFAAVALAMPFVFIAVIVAALVSRGRSGAISPTMAALVAFTGGLTLGTMVSTSLDPAVLAPPLAVGTFVTYGLWHRRRWAQAGWLLAGLALPSALLWSYSAALLLGGRPFGPISTWAFLAASVGALIVAVVVVRRGDPPPPSPNIEAPAGQPGSRSFGNITEAIRDPARVGPFGLPEVSMLAAIVVTTLVVPFLVPRGLPELVRTLIVGLAVAAIGTEVYVRAWPSVSRRAFEAFSWLGDWELAQAREITGGGVPSSKDAASAWLARRPERREELPLRIELLLFVGRIDEARRLLPAVPAETPWERFIVAALDDLIDWRAGGDGNIAAMEAAAAVIEPPDGDDRLRADVSIATARVRRRMAEGRPTPAEVVEPLLEVRERLGHRADGQIGRALRRRVFPLLFLGSVLLMLLAEALGMGAGLLS
jgi:hypothetical protein